jgi:hypothetical protein
MNRRRFLGALCAPLVAPVVTRRQNTLKIALDEARLSAARLAQALEKHLSLQPWQLELLRIYRVPPHMIWTGRRRNGKTLLAAEIAGVNG